MAYILNMSKQSLAELLGKLEKNGYIKRETSEQDRRSFNIKITEKGAAVADEIDDILLDLENLFDCLNDEEIENFSNYLKRITEHLEKQFGGENDLNRHVHNLRKQAYRMFMEHNRNNFKKHDHTFNRDNARRFFRGRFSNNRDEFQDDDE